MSLTDKISKKQIIILGILLLGLIAGVILVQNYQTLRGRAEGTGPLNINTNQGEVQYNFNEGIHTYTVEEGSDIQINIPD